MRTIENRAIGRLGFLMHADKGIFRFSESAKCCNACRSGDAAFSLEGCSSLLLIKALNGLVEIGIANTRTSQMSVPYKSHIDV
jgi:hypothetical protein